MEHPTMQGVEGKEGSLPAFLFHGEIRQYPSDRGSDLLAELPFGQSLLVLPTYNEIENIQTMLRTLHSLYPQLSVLVVDDGSPDGTAQAVKNFARFKSNLHLIEREGKQGLGSAYIAGFKFALERDYQYV